MTERKYDVSTLQDALNEVVSLFLEIRRRHGDAQAKALFGSVCAKPKKHQQNEFKKLGLLNRYDAMQPKPNVMALARQLHAEDKDEYPSVEAAEQELRRLKRTRKSIEEKFSATSPRLGAGEVVSFVLHPIPIKNR